ncbi:DHA2 family methylenomycin A resistance protein-like MFS transporter [Thermosporothrix hazakensis]|jgi:DHA2 family methylenomycin A resistance protein-like MFS transporter|uniref:DHA2 family methylenomycin A resistance protein-like MFS transporter n=1 Tax=Thermosporothrix hazakensis TaxID=644383 RepID=A0A326UBQ1_THEHA|nr:MFS transporter [Thermosporothrix hazakensis]PZW31112.1 DHA2 family methylenomycin A resistance protein-like MFS transporter [Thermosporothrix hazakensis]GCE50974.1 MFS transporter [Thermosporothrix hazakensis]
MSRQHIERTKNWKQAAAILALSLGSFIVLLDTTILNVALPALQHSLHASLENIQWIADSYILIFVSFLLTAGTLGDRFGVRTVFGLGLLIFIGSSLICSLVRSVEWLIIARALQGAGAAVLLPNSLSLVAHLFEDPQERNRAVAAWGGISSLAVASGPLLGGILVDSFGWPSIFLINIPAGLLALVLMLLTIQPIPAQSGKKLDLAGQVFAILACLFLSYGLIEWQHLPPALRIGMLALAILCTLLFIRIEAHSSQPMLPLALFRSRKVSTTLFVALAYQFSFFGMLFAFAIYFQHAYGYGAFETGLAFLPQTAFGSFLLLFMTKHIMRLLRPEKALAIGLLLGMTGMLVVLLGLHTSLPVILLGELLIGALAGFVASPMTAVVLENVPKELSGVASAALNAARQIGGLLSVAILGSQLGKETIKSGIEIDVMIMASACLLGVILCLLSMRTSGLERKRIKVVEL